MMKRLAIGVFVSAILILGLPVWLFIAWTLSRFADEWERQVREEELP